MKKVFEESVIKAQVNDFEICCFAAVMLPQTALLGRHTAGRLFDAYSLLGVIESILVQISKCKC